MSKRILSCAMTVTNLGKHILFLAHEIKHDGYKRDSLIRRMGRGLG